ncbi:MAG: PD-(D/E)XK nuclease family protein [Opitutaceae bacterium]|nr:PD-(D/E)XK nuclease family protein [Cytophagales bacterium]
MEAEKLLIEYLKIPKETAKPTFLEICKYPGSRFEEICSRILCFFFDPHKPHGFKDLFLVSFFEAIVKEYPDFTSLNFVDIKSEVYTVDGKRIDILIEFPGYIIAIENKITASLYNPLDSYWEHISKGYHDKIGVVLTVFPISFNERINLGNFINLTYSTFFHLIKKNIGRYLMSSNERDLIFLNDFMKTIDNYNFVGSLNSPLDKFFDNNEEDINKLIEHYKDFQNNIFIIQTSKIKEIQEYIKTEYNLEFWDFEKWDLGIFIQLTPFKFGIESHFEKLNGNPLGKFSISINTWDRKSFDYFQPYILKTIAGKHPEFRDGRVFVEYEILINSNTKEIAEKLINLYKQLISDISSANNHLLI